jgi:hypothetical protein
MAEGLTVIAAGLVVVLGIMASMFVLIEVILKFDQLLRDRAERALSPESAEPAVASEAPAEGGEVIAAIGLALQKHLAGRAASRRPAVSRDSGPSAWASSGRLGIMTERQRVTTRRS